MQALQGMAQLNPVAHENIQVIREYSHHYGRNQDMPKMREGSACRRKEVQVL